MERNEFLVKSLAKCISKIREDEVMEQFYEEVTEKTFGKYFSYRPDQYGVLSKPYLVYGQGGMERDGRYYMLKRKMLGLRKAGHKFVPSRSESKKNASFAKRLMDVGDNAKPHVTKTSYGIDLDIEYTKEQRNYGTQVIGAVDEFGPLKARMTKGALSSVDRLIIRGIEEWATSNGLKIEYELE